MTISFEGGLSFSANQKISYKKYKLKKEVKKKKIYLHTRLTSPAKAGSQGKVLKFTHSHSHSQSFLTNTFNLIT